MSGQPVTVRSEQRANRRQALIEATVAVFSEKGVSATSVDDIVRAAGVAKGTFYLYFATKDDAVTAVATWMVEGVADRIEAVASDPGRSPVERLLAFGEVARGVMVEPYERDLIEIFHRPENRSLHDRITERAVVRMTPAVTAIIAEGIELGLFRRQDPRRTAFYVMACFGALDEVISDPADLGEGIDELNAFVLGALGYRGDRPA